MAQHNGRDTLAAVFALVRDPTLTEGALRLWLLYRSYDSGNGAWISDGKVAEAMNKSIRSVKAYRAELQGRGLLEQTKRGPRTALYKAVAPGAAAAPDTPSPPPPKKARHKPAASAPRRALPPDWKPNDAHRALARELGVQFLHTEADAFRDHAAAKGRTMQDWDAAFRMWLRKAREFRRDAPGNTRHRTTAIQDYSAATDQDEDEEIVWKR